MRILFLGLLVFIFCVAVKAEDISVPKEPIGKELSDLTQEIEALGYQHGVDFEITSSPDDYQGKEANPENLIEPARVFIRFKRNIPPEKIDEVIGIVKGFDGKKVAVEKQSRKNKNKQDALVKLRAIGLTEDDLRAILK